MSRLSRACGPAKRRALGADVEMPPAKRPRQLLPENAKIAEILLEVLHKVACAQRWSTETPIAVTVAVRRWRGPEAEGIQSTDDSETFRTYGENVPPQQQEQLLHLHVQLCAAINTQQLPTPAKRNTRTNVLPDPNYDVNYKKWLEFLELYATAGETICERMDLSFLRSLMMVNATEIMKSLSHSALADTALPILSLLCDACGFNTEEEGQVLSHAPVPQFRQEESKLASETGIGFLRRDHGGAAEEQSGIITFECITNDRQPDHMMKLVALKNIFSRQLPKMPREYIVRLVFDRNHCSFCLLKKGKVIGGTCFRPYFAQRFAEIAFLAVTSTEQVKGYGTRLMNHLKEHVKRAGLDFFLTYADNFAIGYFRKQGFTQKISLPRDQWLGYIKDYDGGTLMECFINPKINYLRLSEMLADQKRVVRVAIRHVKPTQSYPGLTFWKDNPNGALHPSQIPGLVKAGWKEGQLGVDARRRMRPLHDQILAVIDILNRHENAWPFRKPVSDVEAPNYFNIIKKPIDISAMKKAARRLEYKSRQQFAADVRLMFQNCRTYNSSDTIYYKYANELETFIQPKIEALPEDRTTE